MKMIIKHLIVVGLVLSLLLLACGCTNEEEEPDSLEINGFILSKLTQSEPVGTYYIVKYKGEEENLVLPSYTPKGKVISSIGPFAFAYRNNLKTVEIPEGYVYIGKTAFFGCEQLEKVIIGAEVTEISCWEAFSMCNNLVSFEVSEQNKYYYAEGNCIIDRRTNSVVYGCKNSVIPDGIEEIGTCAFNELYTLESIRIPESVKKIGMFAFFNAVSLKEIFLDYNIQIIEDGAFSKCYETVIYCSFDERPEGWSEIWCGADEKTTIVWGYQNNND